MLVTREGRTISVRTASELDESLKKEMSTLSPEEREALRIILQDFHLPPPTGPAATQFAQPNLLAALSAAEYKTVPVDMRTFIKDPEFLGNTCDSLYPKFLDDLVDLFSGGYNECVFCLHPDTPVPLLDGTAPTIKALAERFAVDQTPFWVYGVEESGKVVPAQAENPRKTGEDDYYEVTLDDGSVFTGNARHQMILRDGSKRMIRDMRAGDSLMPFDTKVSSRGEGRRIHGYEMVRTLDTENFRYTHALVEEDKAGSIDSKAVTVHHRNFKKLDNTPKNLERLTWRAHTALHHQHRMEYLEANPVVHTALRDRETKNATDPESPLRKGHREFMRSAKGRALSRKNLAQADVPTEALRARGAKGSRSRWCGEGSGNQKSAASDRLSARNRDGNSVSALRARWKDPAQREAARLRMAARNKANAGKARRSDITAEAVKAAVTEGASTLKAASVALGCSTTRVRRALVDAGIDPKTVFASRRNHYVVSIEKVGHGPVYCMTVPRTTNFAICTDRSDGSHSRSGVFSSNTGAIGIGKCLAGETEIYDTQTGRRRTVDEPGMLAVPSKTDSGLLSSMPAVSIPSGVKPCVRVTLSAGQSVVPSTDHAIFTARGWVEAASLTTDDLVATPRSLPAPITSKSFSDNEVKLIAYLLADGGMTTLSTTFTNGKRVLLDEFKALVESEGDCSTYQNWHKDSASGIKEKTSLSKATEFSVTGLAHKVRGWGINSHSRDKRVPSDFYGLPARQIALFLSRFWSCDGYINPGKCPQIDVTLASQGLVDDLRHMMLRLGIPSRKSFKWATIKQQDGSKKKYPAWRLLVTGAPAVRNFIETVGPVLGKEAFCAEAIASCDRVKAPNPNVDLVPIRIPELREIRKELGWSERKMRSRFSLAAGSCMSRSRFERLCAETGYKGRYAWLASSDLVWDLVERVEPVGDREVYDLSVPGTHNFVANQIVVHNTFVCTIGIARVLYEISCLKDPHKTFGLARDTNITLACFSVNEELATKVVFENIKTKITASPYFMQSFPFSATKKELRFPHNVWVAPRATTDTSALGLNIISAFMDEGNFLPKRGKYSAAAGIVDHADLIYSSLKRRMKSRFEKAGKLPGILFIASSKTTHEDFVSRRLKEARDDPTLFVRDYALWEVKPEDYYSVDKFQVLVGNETIPSKILDPGEADRIRPSLPDGTLIINVPEDFRIDFERDLEGSVKDIAGCSVVSVSPFIQRREKLVDAVEQDKKTYGVDRHFFSKPEYDPSKGGQFVWEKAVRLTPDPSMRGQTDVMRPIINPNAMRHVHIDIGLRHDALGLCMAHIGSFRDVVRRSPNGEQHLERAPVFVVDLMLRVTPPPGDEIILGDVRRLIYELAQHGYTITSVSTDSYQSTDLVQQLNQKGFNAKIVSVDTSTEPYESLKTAFYEDRVFVYEHATLLTELRQLQRDYRKRKIDHPSRGCFTGDTEVLLADGCTARFDSLVQHTSVPIITYAGSPAPAMGLHPRETMLATEIVEVELEDGSVVRCTPDHRFLLADGSYKEAQHLTPEDELQSWKT